MWLHPRSSGSRLERTLFAAMGQRRLATCRNDPDNHLQGTACSMEKQSKDHATAPRSISHEMELVVAVFLVPTVPRGLTGSQA